MSDSIAISGAMEFKPTREEILLRTYLRVFLVLPLAIFQYVLIIFLSWLIHRLLFSIIRHYASLKLTSKDAGQIKAINSNLKNLSESLRQYYDILCKMEKQKIFFVSNRVKGVAEMIENYNDLALAYNIFLEPVNRDYTVAEEYRNLRKGRKIINLST